MKIAIYGDSISTVEYGDGGYEEMLRIDNGLEKIYNHAVSATCLTAVMPDSGIEIIKKKENRHPDADVIILWHGTNDWYYGNQLGEDADTDELTFCGALNSAIRLLKDTNPEAKIILPTPLLRWQAPVDGEEGEALLVKNRIGITQTGYTDAIRCIGLREGCIVIDMRKETGFTVQDIARYLPDGVHPSKEGYKVITRIFTENITKSVCR